MLFPPCSPDLLLFQSGPKQLKIRRLFQWRGRLRVWTLQRWQTSDKPNIVFAAIGKSGTVYQIGHKGIELRTPKFTKMRRFQEGEGEGGDEIKWRFKKRKEEEAPALRNLYSFHKNQSRLCFGDTTVESKDYYLFTLQLSSGLSKVQPSVKIVLKTGVEKYWQKKSSWICCKFPILS